MTVSSASVSGLARVAHGLAVAAIHVGDFGGDAASQIAQQKGRDIAHVFDRDVAPQRRGLGYDIEQFAEIFDAALDQPSPESRAAFIERATAGDPVLRKAVEELLANNQEDTFLEQGVAEPLRRSMEVAGTLTVHERSERPPRNHERAPSERSDPK